MYIGGVLLASGMELAVTADDQLDGGDTIRLLLHRVDGVRDLDGESWVILSGLKRASQVALTTSTPCRVYVRVSALKHCLVLTTP